MTRTSIGKFALGLVVVGGIVWVLFGFFGVQALFTDRIVNESVPVVVSSEISTTSTTNSITNSSTTPVGESLTNPRVIRQGTFHQGDNTYTIQGKATVTEKEGVRTLSLTDFDVTNGPDLFVYIVSAPDVKNETVKNAVREKQFVNIGELKGNRGNQTYLIPSDAIIDDRSIVSIWCRRFSRNFGSAALQ